MPDTRLILIEGIPGSGKTTTARFVCERLQALGKRPRLFMEGDLDHPADYESVACLDGAQLTQLTAEFPKQATFLLRSGSLDGGNYFFPYRKLQAQAGGDMPEALFTALARFEIYDLPAEKHCQVMLDNWRRFARRAAAEPEVYVFECCFLQNPITTLLARHDLAPEVVYRHVLELARLVAPLQPYLVYLAPTDVAATLEKVRAERPVEWADYVTRYLTGQEYGIKHQLRPDFGGVIDFYAMRQRLELDWLGTLPLFSSVLSDSSTWDERYRALGAFLAN